MRSALTTITKSPTSTWGVYSGLRLPRSMSAIWVASRPSVLPVASTTSQLRSRDSGVATYVFIAEGPPRGGRPEECSGRVSAAPGPYIVAPSQTQPNPQPAICRDLLRSGGPVRRGESTDCLGGNAERASPTANPVGRRNKRPDESARNPRCRGPLRRCACRLHRRARSSHGGRCAHSGRRWRRALRRDSEDRQGQLRAPLRVEV